jgi:hypothetical protein
MTAGLALQNVCIQLCTLRLRLKPGCGALIGGFRPNVKLYFLHHGSMPASRLAAFTFACVFDSRKIVSRCAAGEPPP